MSRVSLATLTKRITFLSRCRLLNSLCFITSKTEHRLVSQAGCFIAQRYSFRLQNITQLKCYGWNSNDNNQYGSVNFIEKDKGLPVTEHIGLFDAPLRTCAHIPIQCTYTVYLPMY